MAGHYFLQLFIRFDNFLMTLFVWAFITLVLGPALWCPPHLKVKTLFQIRFFRFEKP